MASTRQTSRSRSGSAVESATSPVSKRRKSNNSSVLTLLSTPASAQDDNANAAAQEFEEAEVVEEVVVTVDEPAQEDESQQTSDSIAESLFLVQTTTTTPGGQLISEDTTDSDKPSSVFVFKDPNFIHASKGPGGNKRTRIWKNLKQIVAQERTLPWGPNDVTYGSIDAPPSFKPAKKYSDVSGLEARYTDPQTKMRYANADEYRRVRMLPGDIVTGCLQLRKANTLVP